MQVSSKSVQHLQNQWQSHKTSTHQEDESVNYKYKTSSCDILVCKEAQQSQMNKSPVNAHHMFLLLKNTATCFGCHHQAKFETAEEMPNGRGLVLTILLHTKYIRLCCS